MSSVLAPPPVEEKAAPAPEVVAPSTPEKTRLEAIRAAAWRVVKPSIAILAFLGLWEVAPRIGLADPVFLPPFTTVLDALGNLWSSGQLSEHLTASLSRAVIGFSVAVVTAIPVGIAIAWYRPVSEFISPILELFRNTAALALLPVFVLILGIGEESKIALVIFACFFPVLLNTISGVRTVDPLLIKSASSLGLPPVRLFQKVVLPAAVPTIFTGIQMAAASSILVLIAAEMVGAKAGLGYLITASQLNFQIPNMYAGIVTISILGVTLNGILVTIERRLSRWRENN